MSGGRLLLAAALVAAPVAVAVPAAADGGAYDQVVDLTFPTDPRSTYSDSYDAGRSGGRTHKATDIMGEKGFEVHAAVGGTITWMPGTDGTEPSYGYMITIDGDDGRDYSYVHLNNDTPGTDDGNGGPSRAYAAGLERGDRVERGQLIGWMGDSGNAEGTAPHLHFEIEDETVTDPYGSHRINPYNSLRAAEDRNDYPQSRPEVHVRGTTAACPEDRVPDAGFVDVPEGSTHADAVDCAVWWGVASGLTDTEYGPELDVSRGQMASFMARLVEASGRALPNPTQDHFADDNGSPHEESINRLAEAGVVGGTGPGTYAPDASVSRGQLATFLVRAWAAASGQDLPAGDDHFADDQGNVHEPNIDRAAAAGFAGGTGNGVYEPEHPVRRGQMASFVARVLDRAVAEGRSQPPA